MEFLWLAIGLAVGLTGAWFFFEARSRSRLAEQETRLSETNRRIQRALERELSAHEGTKHRLARMNEEDKAQKERIESLNTDVDANRKVLESVQADAAAKGLEVASLELKIEELESELSESEKKLEEFNNVVARARSHSDATTEGIMAKLATLESRLVTDGDEDDARPDAEADESEPDDDRHEAQLPRLEAEIAELKARLTAQDTQIASLEAERDALRETTAAPDKAKADA